MARDYSGSSYELDPKTGFMAPKEAGKGVSVKAKQEFLRIYRETANMGKSCKMAGIDRTTVYSHFEFDTKFELLFREMVEELCDDKEEIIHGMAPKNLLAAFGFLKAYRPHIWNEKKIVNISQSNVSKLDYLINKLKKNNKVEHAKKVEPVEKLEILDVENDGEDASEAV